MLPNEIIRGQPTCTRLTDRIAVKSGFAHLAAFSFGVEHALQTFTGVRIAIARFRDVDVVATVAVAARATGHFGIPIVVLVARVTPRT